MRYFHGFCVSCVFVVGISVSSLVSASVSNVQSLHLYDELTIEAGWARSFLQDGIRRSFSQLDQWQPYCSVEVKEVSTQNQRIAVSPGVFTVERISRKSHPGVSSASILLDSNEIGPVDLQVDFALSSATNNSIVRLRCNRTVDHQFHSLELSLDEIETALGQLAALQ